MVPRGGRRVARGLEELRQALIDYYGQVNERKTMASQGYLTSAEPLEKPEALALFELVQFTGLPIVSGGVIDQPIIWLEEMTVVNEVMTFFTKPPKAG